MTESVFTIDTIEATPDCSTLSWNDPVVKTPQGQRVTIWDSAKENEFKNAIDGSTHPATFLLPNANPPTIPIHIHGSISLEFEPDGNTKGLVTASLGSLDLFRAAVIVGSQDQVVVIDKVELVNAYTRLPTRSSGDFQFRLELYHPKAKNPILAKRTPRLEISFALGPCPSSETSPNNRVRADFGGRYPVILLRLFFPSLSEALSIAGIHPPVAPETWYIKRAVDTIWKFGTTPDVNKSVRIPRKIHYDNVNGAPSYGVSPKGVGTFQLSRWAKAQFDQCNCQDLAAIVQLACNVLVSGPNSIEVVDSRWIEHRPHGFLNPGTLFGWPEYPRCNNPTWKNKDAVWKFAECPVAKVDTATGYPLEGFAQHSWVEIVLPGDTGPGTVLDATLGLLSRGGQPETGSTPRGAYLNTSLIQTTVNPNPLGNGTTKTTANPNGDCLQTPESGPDIGLKAISLTKILSPISRVALKSMEDIATDTERPLDPTFDGTNPEEPPRNFVCADLTVPKLHELAEPVLGQTTIGVSEYLVGTTGAQVLAGLDVAAEPDMEAPPTSVFIEVTAYLDLLDAAMAVTDRLNSSSTGRAPYKKSPENDRVGDMSYVSPIEVFFARSNVFVRVFGNGLAPGVDYAPKFLAVGRALDAHMSQRLVGRPELPMPSPKLGQGPPETVPVGGIFTLAITEDSAATTLVEKVAHVEDSSVLQWLGPKFDDGRFEFLATKKGITKVVLVVAHESHLLPGTEEVSVTVV
ncbi:hypothetical protein BDY21DRAFT_354728 [Lineolata rhizophorae]|uniref:Uncharacterized protein n=1 Tax=Lineolata rhizophorae TaxID=578093 RepID=A0A6A6NRR9_9PEZI|nr:hypothetical protein BDY21DRAFT_354728 [Lineolata rhizophorae]